MTAKDVVRHPLVMQIVRAYERENSKEEQKSNDVFRNHRK